MMISTNGASNDYVPSTTNTTIGGCALSFDNFAVGSDCLPRRSATAGGVSTATSSFLRVKSLRIKPTSETWSNYCSEESVTSMSSSNRSLPSKSCLSIAAVTVAVPASKAVKKSVSFHAIDIHEHIRILGDNPSVSAGPPISVGWTKVKSHRVLLADYEEHRPPRRHGSSLAIPAFVRERLLLDEGVTIEDMQVAVLQGMHIKRSRIYAMRQSQSRSPLLSSFKFIRRIWRSGDSSATSDSNKPEETETTQAESSRRQVNGKPNHGSDTAVSATSLPSTQPLDGELPKIPLETITHDPDPFDALSLESDLDPTDLFALEKGPLNLFSLENDVMLAMDALPNASYEDLSSLPLIWIEDGEALEQGMILI